MTVRDDLLAVAALLEPEGAWTQHTAARDEKGRCVGVAYQGACSFCLAGAINRVIFGSGDEYWERHTNQNRHEFDRVYALGEALDDAAVAAWDFKRAKLEDSGRDPFVRWNDKPGRTQAEVIALVRRAAEAAA